MNTFFVRFAVIGVIAFLTGNPIYAGNGTDTDTIQSLPIQVQYMALRPAKWEEKALTEEVNEKRNVGGLVFVYYTNTTAAPVELREWYLNKKDNGYWRMAGDIAWDRQYTNSVQPGQTTVLEISGVSDAFQVGKPAEFALLGSNWQPVAYQTGVFEKEEARITSIVFDSSLTQLTIHLRNLSEKDFKINALTVEGNENEKLWLSDIRVDKNGHIIAKLKLKQAFNPGDLCILKCVMEVNGQTKTLYSHSNAYADYFPNGTWGVNKNQYEDAEKHHLNTMVYNGKSTDEFYSTDYKRTGIKAMLHTGIYPDIDLIRDLENHPAVACWYLQDEPDWTQTPQLMMGCNQMTKKYSVKKPSLITLCRNVKFFEYAFFRIFLATTITA
jgi:hypothetical protein